MHRAATAKTTVPVSGLAAVSGTGPNSLPLIPETPMFGSRQSGNMSGNAMTALKLNHLRIVLGVLAGLSVLVVFVAAIF